MLSVFLLLCNCLHKTSTVSKTISLPFYITRQQSCDLSTIILSEARSVLFFCTKRLQKAAFGRMILWSTLSMCTLLASFISTNNEALSQNSLYLTMTLEAAAVKSPLTLICLRKNNNNENGKVINFNPSQYGS